MFEPSDYSRLLYRSIRGVLLHRIRLNKIVKACNALEGKYVLEIGCHDLLFYSLINKQYQQYIGIDLNLDFGLPFAIKNKKRMGWRRVELFNGDAEYLPYKDELFDLIFCFETIEHLSNKKRAILEIARVLKPGGNLVISIPIEFGLILILKATIRFLIGQREYNLVEFLRATFYCELEKVKRKEHKGYDYRSTIINLQKNGFIVKNKMRYPFVMLPDSLNVGVILFLEKKGPIFHPSTNKI